ncbi:MAG TPA: LytR C-terminal domain-containing protein [Solirubrobacteraceae bacterium]|jgi:hypothetical protein
MQTISFAVSVHHFISSVGADAGFAALIAVALLILLYFSQARETATLRHRADEAGQRVQELEGQLAELADHVAALPAEISVHAVAPRPAHAYAGAHVPAGVGASSDFPPAAPAGVGAPALAAATKLIPDPVQPAGQREPATVGLIDRPGGAGTAVQGAPPVTVGGGNGSSGRPVAAAATIQRAARPAAGGPLRPGSGPPRASQGRPSGPQGRRPGGPAPGTMSLRTGPRRTRAGTVLMVLAALLGVGAVVAGVITVTNLHNSSSASKSSVASSNAASHRTTTPLPAVVPSTVTVSVLNGTDTSELARTVSDKLATSGYKKGYVGNYGNSQTKTLSVVAYMRGDKRDATAVAAALKLPTTSVQPIDTTTQQIACPPASGPCTSAVIVTVGSNLAGLATSTATQ